MLETTSQGTNPSPSHSRNGRFYRLEDFLPEGMVVV